MNNKHGIPVLDGSFSRLECMLMKEKDPESKVRYDKRNRYPTLKYALEQAGYIVKPLKGSEFER